MPMRAIIASGEEPLVRRFTAGLVEIGLEVECIPETGRALELLSKQRYDALLLDCDLEGGLDLVELIRQSPSNSKALLVACATAPEVVREAGKAGANFVLNKPINWEMAKRTLRAAQTVIIPERRDNIREKVLAPAKLRVGEQTVEVLISDMSGTGVALKNAPPLPVGKQVQIEFHLPNTNKSIQSTSKVVWVKNGMVGLHFLYLSPASAQAIMGWLSRHSPRHKKATT